MPGSSAIIGALRVQLGLDSAQFSNGLKKSQGALSKFGISAGAAMAGLAAAAATAAVALGHAVKASIDHADELGKTAQKVGVTVEALSRLEYAAKLSDIGIEGLSTGLGKLSQNMLSVANGAGGTVATAFAALGVKVKQADGTLRSSVDVLGDIADRFAGMEDGATKTALAIQVFGKSGKDLIPLLNAGSAGLADMATEADRLGVTISGKTAKSAEEFNDNLTRLGAVFEGLVNKITEEALPSLVKLSETIADPSFQGAIVSTTSLFVGMADVLARTAALAYELVNILPQVAAGEDDAVANLPGQKELINNALGINDIGGDLPAFNDFLKQMNVVGNDDVGGNLPTFNDFLGRMGITPATEPTITKVGGSVKSLGEAMEETKDPAAELNEQLEALGNIGVDALTGFTDILSDGKIELSEILDLVTSLAKQLLQLPGSNGSGSWLADVFKLGAGTIGSGNWNIPTGFQPGGFYPGLGGTAAANLNMADAANVNGPEITFINQGTPQRVVEQRSSEGGRKMTYVLADQVSAAANTQGSSLNRTLNARGAGAPLPRF